MHRDSDRQRLFNRRALMLAGGKVGLLSILVGRMYYLQVVESDRYATLAEENRINLRLLPPPRGPIVDRFGARVSSSLSYLFTETGASPNISAAGVLPSMTCTGGTPCTVGGGFAEVGLMAGAFRGDHDISMIIALSGLGAVVVATIFLAIAMFGRLRRARA